MSTNNKTGVENRAFEFEMCEPQKKNGKIDNNANNAKLSDSNKDLEDDIEGDRCGLFFYSPEWIQKFATKRAFIVVFGLLGVIQSMTWSYFTATISTLEKRFKISSQTSGIVMTGNEISQIILSLLIAHYGAKGHRPRLIATGVVFSALSCFVLSSPHFFYGSGNEALGFTEEYWYLGESGGEKNVSFAAHNHGSFIKSKVTLCEGSNIKSDCQNEPNLAPLILIFMSQFVAGIGVVLFYTLGGPYLDDNTKRKNMPIVFGITMSLRLIGPTIGYAIASGALKLYVNPLLTPYITNESPNWTGCWWLGWVILGTCMLFTSFFIALFPKRLRRKNENKEIKEAEPEVETIPKLAEIPKAVKLLLKNKINIFNNLAGVFYLFSGVGYWTFMPKYLETIFMQTASSSSMISGVVGIFSSATGILISGFLISKYRISARKLAAWNVFTAFLYVLVKISFTQIGCDVGKISFGTEMSDGTWNLSSTCNQDCNCKTSKILPVCHKEENTVYYSACHAGCTYYDNSTTVSNCSCVPGANLQLGNCAEGCTQLFILFLAISALIKFIESTGRVGNMLISYRCVSLKERSLSIGLNILLLSAFSMLPSPILFGRIIDSVCLVWGGSSCGKKGNCMLYNGEQLRYIFNLTAASFTFIGGCFDCLVWYLSKDLELYKEPDEDEGKDCSEQQKENITGG